MKTKLRPLPSAFDKIRDLDIPYESKIIIYNVMCDLANDSFNEGMDTATDIWRPKTQD